jgi:hypothetical protein
MATYLCIVNTRPSCQLENFSLGDGLLDVSCDSEERAVKSMVGKIGSMSRVF